MAQFSFVRLFERSKGINILKFACGGDSEKSEIVKTGAFEAYSQRYAIIVVARIK